MTYEEKKKLIEAAKVIQEHCTKRSKTACGDCPFLDCGCSLNANYPTYWRVPTITHWTPEDVALAKALKGFGGIFIVRGMQGAISCRFDNGDICDVPVNAFVDMDIYAIDLDTIIKEAEG